jgi:osmotically-inducible protein OsmY
MAAGNPSTRTRPPAIGSPRDNAAREALEAAARAALSEAAYEPVRRVECSVRDGTVVLYGRAPSFYLKQIAQSVVASRLNGAAKIENRIEVPRAP